MEEPPCTCEMQEFSHNYEEPPVHNHFHLQPQGAFASATLPKQLKGILKKNTNGMGSISSNGSYTGMSYTLPREIDVVPFDNMPPCDDCLSTLRYQVNHIHLF